MIAVPASTHAQPALAAHRPQTACITLVRGSLMCGASVAAGLGSIAAYTVAVAHQQPLLEDAATGMLADSSSCLLQPAKSSQPASNPSWPGQHQCASQPGRTGWGQSGSQHASCARPADRCGRERAWGESQALQYGVHRRPPHLLNACASDLVPVWCPWCGVGTQAFGLRN